MAAEESTRNRREPIAGASQQGSSAGGQGTGLSLDPARGAPRDAVKQPGRTRGDARLRLAEARHVSRDPLPDQARRAPILRANPYPEVTDPICRLPLPTLFYRLEAIHLGDLRRIWVRAGATPPLSPLPDFQGPRGRYGHRRNCGALRVPNHISLLEDSMELERSCRKENSSRISRRRLRIILGYPDELSCEGPTY
ncbi:hypothetical protein ILUMI_15088 [Ignelater luminosus]|uniref:Uncharacterized protein n=1 Tax=Ignelater luminosus TaxID=2038154 RepID=A0A8K0CXA3_IGNLU|nr:hypothetical protein ILUMI_15088 [Ignelater luminosus]